MALDGFDPQDSSSDDASDQDDPQAPAGDTDSSDEASTPTAAPQGPRGSLTPNAQAIADVMADHGYTPEQIAGRLAVGNYEGAGLNSHARNASSGAYGISQDLGSRQSGLYAFAQQNNLDPGEARTQALYDQHELDTSEAPADHVFRTSETPEEGASNWRKAFERPGVNYDNVTGPLARQSLPYVKAYLASRSGSSGNGSTNDGSTFVGGMTDEGPAPGSQPEPAAEPAYDHAWDAVIRERARATGQPDPTLPGPPRVDNVPLPKTQTSPVADPWADVIRERDRQRQQAAQGGAPAPGGAKPPPMVPGSASVPTPPPTGLGHEILANLGQAPLLFRGFFGDTLGMAGDAVTALSNYFTKNPSVAMSVGAGGGYFGLPNTWQVPSEPTLTDAHGNKVNPSNPIANLVSPLTSPSITANMNAGAEHIGLGKGYFNTPAENGDFDVGHNMSANVFRFIGAGVDPMNPLGVIGAARAALAGSARGIGKEFATHWLAPAGIAGGADLGVGLTGALGGDENEQRLASYVGIPLGIGIRAGLEGAAVLGMKGAKAGKNLLGGLGTDKPPIFDNPEMARDALSGDKFESGLPFPQSGLPEGYQIPAMTRTLDQGGQAFFQQTVRQDRIANGQYRDLIENNVNALNGAAPGGDPGDAVNYVRNVQNARQQTYDMSIANAKQDADLAEKAASQSTSGQPLFLGSPGREQLFNYGNVLVSNLSKTRDAAKADVDAAWDQARANGFTTATADPKPMYTSLEGLMQKHIQDLQDPKSFPWREISPLYQDGDPRGMFNAQGMRNPKTIGAGTSAGPNATLQGPVTLDTLHNLESSLGNAARQEQDLIRSGNGGSPLRLRNITAVRAIVTRTLEQGAMASGNYAGMRAAMDATATYYNTFGQGIIGDVLSNADTSLAPEAVAKYIANSTKSQATALEFQKNLVSRLGPNAERPQDSTLDPQAPGMGTGSPTAATDPNLTPGGALHNALADYMRQKYLLVRSEGGPLAGEKWAANQGPLLSGLKDPKDPLNPFTRLSADVERLNQSDAVLRNLPQQAGRNQDAVDEAMMKTYLGADEGKEFEAVLNGQGQADRMQRLVGLTRQDGTGQAFRGLQKAAFDRLIVAGQKYSDQTGEMYFSGQAALKYYNDHLGAFHALSDADPVVGTILEKVINAMAADEQIRAKPNVAELPKDLNAAAQVPGASPLGQFTARHLGTVGRIAGAMVGRHMETRTIQVPGIMAEQGEQVVNSAYQGLTGKEAPQLRAINMLRDALFDPVQAKALLDAHTAELGQMQRGGMGVGEAAVRGAVTGNRAAGQAAQNQKPTEPGIFSPKKPWVRSGGIEAGHSILNANQTGPQIHHQFPVIQPPGQQPPPQQGQGNSDTPFTGPPGLGFREAPP